MEKKALVTGGAGFIGSNVVRVLIDRGYGVVIYDNLSTGYRENVPRSPQVQFVKGDIMDERRLCEAGVGCTVLFHLAASVGNIKSMNEKPSQETCLI